MTEGICYDSITVKWTCHHHKFDFITWSNKWFSARLGRTLIENRSFISCGFVNNKIAKSKIDDSAREQPKTSRERVCKENEYRIISYDQATHAG